MILPDKKIKQDNFVHIYDFDSKCPEGQHEYYAMIWFDDHSHTLWSKIFAPNRTDAYRQVTWKFQDCFEHIADISVHPSED